MFILGKCPLVSNPFNLQFRDLKLITEVYCCGPMHLAPDATLWSCLLLNLCLGPASNVWFKRIIFSQWSLLAHFVHLRVRTLFSLRRIDTKRWYFKETYMPNQRVTPKSPEEIFTYAVYGICFDGTEGYFKLIRFFSECLLSYKSLYIHPRLRCLVIGSSEFSELVLYQYWKGTEAKICVLPCNSFILINTKTISRPPTFLLFLQG